MSPKRPARSIINVPASAELKAEMDIYALKGGHTRIAKGGEVVANKAAYLRALHAANVAQIGPVEDAPKAITFESMTPGEQWHFLDEVTIHSGDRAVYLSATALRINLTPASWAAAYNAYSDSDTPGYQARYDAALAYVKGVIDGQ